MFRFSRTSSSIVWWMLSLSSSPSAFIPPVPFWTRSDVAVGGQLGAAGLEVERRLPRA